MTKISCSFKPIYVVENVFCNHQIAFFLNLSVLISVGDAPKFPKWQRFPYLTKSCVKPCHLLSSSPFPLPSLPFFFLLFSLVLYFPPPFSSSIFRFLFYLPICFLFFFPISPACLLSLSSLSFILLVSAFFFPPLFFLFFFSSFSPSPFSILLISPLKDIFSAWHLPSFSLPSLSWFFFFFLPPPPFLFYLFRLFAKGYVFCLAYY